MLSYLVQKQALSEELRSRMLGWRHSGFSVHNQVRGGEENAAGRGKPAGYMVRAPMSLEKMRYNPNTGTVIYRSKMHLGLKRNFQVIPARSGWSCCAATFLTAMSISFATSAGTRTGRAVSGRRR